MIVSVSERTHTSVFLNDWSRVRECVGSVLWQWVRDMAQSQSIYSVMRCRAIHLADRSLCAARSDGARAAARGRREEEGRAPPQEGVGYASRAGSAPQFPPTPTRARASRVQTPHI